ncbi:MAG: hypothetical protein KDJ83_12130 [Rhodobacteraceae bacterium]|nr:hypothetical protein [Paracoccaceae bacterium]
MHESDSFIHEVSEEVRRDRFYAFLRRWGWLIGAVLVLIIGGAAVHEWRKARMQAAAEAAGDAMRAAYLETDPAERAGRLGEIAVEIPEAAVLARFAEAGSRIEAGERDAAAALLAELSTDGGVSDLYRQLAALQRVMLLGADLDASERLAALEMLTGAEAPFRPLALEQRALARIDAGDAEAAQSDLQAILDDPAAPEQVRARARQLIVATGGEVAPVDAAPAATVDG